MSTKAQTPNPSAANAGPSKAATEAKQPTNGQDQVQTKTKETKEQKLKRLAGNRVSMALTKIRLVGNLGAYSPSTEQANKIISTLRTAVSDVERRLQVTKVTKESEFQL